MGANEKREATFHGSDDAARVEAERRHGIVNVAHRGILGGWAHLCSCGASVIEPEGGRDAIAAHLAGPPNPPRKPRTYRQGYADGKAWQATQPVVVTAEQVEAATRAAVLAAGWDWMPVPGEFIPDPESVMRGVIVAALATLPGITVEPTPGRTFVQAADDEPGDDLPGSWTPTRTDLCSICGEYPSHVEHRHTVELTP